MQTFNDSTYRTFKEESAGDLTGSETLALALGTAADTVKLATSATDIIGFMHQKLEGDDAVNVRLIGNGTQKVTAGGSIAKGARVKWGTGGKVVSASAGDKSHGIKLTQGSSADGDIIEIIVLNEDIPA